MILLANSDARTVPLANNSVQCVITSPPYFGLRDYGTAKWEGGDPSCDHITGRSAQDENMSDMQASNSGSFGCDSVRIGESCSKCGAIRIDSQIGLERTLDGCVANIVHVLREVHRVLKDDGTVWLNLGDSYVSSPIGHKSIESLQRSSTIGLKYKEDHLIGAKFDKTKIPGLKPKDIIGVPWRVAFALQGFGLIRIDDIAILCKAIDSRDLPALDYFRAGFRLWEELSGMDWYWNRQDIVWHKPNPMPESVTDRCTKAHEYIFLLTKSERYYFDYEAIAEPFSSPTGKSRTGMRNKRSVWTVTTKPYSGSHFATYPPDLIEPCILAGCPPGGIVLDPFAGSGTTCLVANKLGRIGIGFDLNYGYLNTVARQRLHYGSYVPIADGVNQLKLV